MSYTTNTFFQSVELLPESIALSFFNSEVNADIASVILDISLRVKLFDPPPELMVADA